MKITTIQISNFIGARAVDVTLNKPIALFAGKNYAGKSSIQEAVRMALVGESVRVDLKKDYEKLITDGQDSGFVTVEWDGGSASAVLPSGKRNLSGDAQLSGALPYVLDAQRFAKLDDKERRAFLFGLMGIKLDGPGITQRMLDRGCDAKKVEQILPMLRAGFDAAQKEAASKARDAKASWKTLTGGETWGKDKAAKWKPAPLPEGADQAAAKIEQLQAQRVSADANLSAATQELGAAKAEANRIREANAKIADLREQASRIDRIQNKLVVDRADLAEWETKVAATRRKAGSVSVDPTAPGEYLLRGLASVTADFLDLTCRYSDIEWDSGLLNRAAVHLSEYRKLHGEPASPDKPAKADPEAVAQLQDYENALALLQRAVTNGERDLEAAKRAAADLKEIESIAPTRDVDALQAKVNELTEARDAILADIAALRDTADAAARRKTLMEQVAKHHQDVIDWTDIADALAPDGIPGDLLAESIDPINERLAYSANEAQWMRINIAADMSIFAVEEGAASRPYALLSESEKYRADAMIAEAVSNLAGVKLLVLDRVDCLDMKGREDLLYWLSGMAQDGEIDTALLFATLKGIPSSLPDGIEAFWIENGMTKEELCLAAA